MASVLGACEGKETHEGGGAEGGVTQTWDVDEWLQAAEAFDLDAAVNGPQRDKGEAYTRFQTRAVSRYVDLIS